MLQLGAAARDRPSDCGAGRPGSPGGVRLGARRSRQGERGAKPGRGGQSGSGRRGGQPGQNGLCQFTAGRPASGRGRCEALRLPERRVVCLPHELHRGRRLLPDGQRPQLTLIERWNGTAWRVEPSPSIGRGSTLDSVSCPSATSCTAVGSLILGWNGASWKVELRSSPFASVSCAAPASCMAAGVTAGGTPESGHFDGTSWKLEPMPRPPHPAQNITLAAVSCAGPGLCLAVGDYSYGVGAMPSPTARDKTFAERWNGSSWRVIPTVNVASWNQLTAVSCTSPRACTAVGSSASGKFALAERWDGAAWPIQRVPGVNRTGPAQLTAVSCSSDSACMAVGTCNAGITAIAESWNGAAWTLHPMPGPPAGLSCTGPAGCVAVGNDGRTLAEI